jgi:hypothetical protein
VITLLAESLGYTPSDQLLLLRTLAQTLTQWQVIASLPIQKPSVAWGLLSAKPTDSDVAIDARTQHSLATQEALS